MSILNKKKSKQSYDFEMIHQNTVIPFYGGMQSRIFGRKVSLEVTESDFLAVIYGACWKKYNLYDFVNWMVDNEYLERLYGFSGNCNLRFLNKFIKEISIYQAKRTIAEHDEFVRIMDKEYASLSVNRNYIEAKQYLEQFENEHSK